MNTHSNRKGAVALTTALMLVVLIGILACAFDIGWIVMTKTQLHAAADSAALAGGTELLPGLGFNATQTPSEIETAATNRAIEFAAKNPAGDQGQVYVASGRDFQFGTGYYNTTTNQWDFNWGATPYNAVQVTPKRNVQGGAEDGPLPLFFAPIIGNNESTISVLSTAVILPANGFRVPPGGGNARLMPFAYEEDLIDKYWRAKTWIDNGGVLADVSETDPMDPDNPTEPLFFDYYQQGNRDVPFQLFDDNFAINSSGNVISSADGIMEFNIFPISQTAGNFGTIDIGHAGNSTADLKRQIVDGVSPDDLAYFPNSELIASLEMNGDTGVSAGIKNSLVQILGQCRSIAVFDKVQLPGNNATYSVVDFVGMQLMEVVLTGNNKRVVMQPCVYSDPGGIPDDDGTIGDNTTVFTPLILAQ